MDELRQQIAAAHAAQEQAALPAKLQIDLALARGNYAKTMFLLRALKAGGVTLEQVVIDGDNWSVLEFTTEQPMPAADPKKEAPEG